MSIALQEVAELIRGETGIVIRDNQLTSLSSAIGRIEPGLDARAFLTRVADPATGGQLLGLLVDEVTVQETYFFREEKALRAVDWAALLRESHARGDEEIRVWVPACATGEEAYTLAMLATEALGPGTIPVSILATDVSTAALTAATEGVYSKRSVSGVPPELADRHLEQAGRVFRLGDELRSLVRFRHHNLVTGGSPPLGESLFDLVVCRNVLIYFEPKAVERVLTSLEAAVRPGGELILGPRTASPVPPPAWLRALSSLSAGNRRRRSASCAGRLASRTATDRLSPRPRGRTRSRMPSWPPTPATWTEPSR